MSGYNEPVGATEYVELDTPIPAFGGEVRVIALRPLKAKDLRKIEDFSKVSASDMISLVSALSNLPVSAIDELSASDFVKVSEVIGGFFETGRK